MNPHGRRAKASKSQCEACSFRRLSGSRGFDGVPDWQRGRASRRESVRGAWKSSAKRPTDTFPRTRRDSTARERAQSAIASHRVLAVFGCSGNGGDFILVFFFPGFYPFPLWGGGESRCLPVLSLLSAIRQGGTDHESWLCGYST